MKIFNGKTVITSCEENKVIPIVNFKNREVLSDHIVWKFDTEDDAYRAAVAFMNADFAYVQRV